VVNNSNIQSEIPLIATPRRDNIKKDIKIMGCEGVDGIKMIEE
jgi:hypothetical protein